MLPSTPTKQPAVRHTPHGKPAAQCIMSIPGGRGSRGVHHTTASQPAQASGRRHHRFGGTLSQKKLFIFFFGAGTRLTVRRDSRGWREGRPGGREDPPAPEGWGRRRAWRAPGGSRTTGRGRWTREGGRGPPAPGATCRTSLASHAYQSGTLALVPSGTGDRRAGLNTWAWPSLKGHRPWFDLQHLRQKACYLARNGKPWTGSEKGAGLSRPLQGQLLTAGTPTLRPLLATPPA